MKRPIPPPFVRLLVLTRAPRSSLADRDCAAFRPRARWRDGRSRSTRILTALLLASSTVQLPACQVHDRVPRREVGDPPEGRITAIVTVGADTVRFDPPKYDRRRPGTALVPAPEIRADTLFATVDGEPYRLPVDQVRQYWVTSLAKGKSFGLAAGILGGVLVGIVVIIGATFGP